MHDELPVKPAWVMERAMGIEPTSEAWEASILPLNYARSGSERDDSITEGKREKRVRGRRLIDDGTRWERCGQSDTRTVQSELG
jgi:hypothetical protein